MAHVMHVGRLFFVMSYELSLRRRDEARREAVRMHRRRIQKPCGQACEAGIAISRPPWTTGCTTKCAHKGCEHDGKHICKPCFAFLNPSEGGGARDMDVRHVVYQKYREISATSMGQRASLQLQVIGQLIESAWPDKRQFSDPAEVKDTTDEEEQEHDLAEIRRRRRMNQVPGHALSSSGTKVSSVVLRTTVENEDGLPCLLYTSPSPRDYAASRMPSSA